MCVKFDQMAVFNLTSDNFYQFINSTFYETFGSLSILKLQFLLMYNNKYNFVLMLP